MTCAHSANKRFQRISFLSAVTVDTSIPAFDLKSPRVAGAGATSAQAFWALRVRTVAVLPARLSQLLEAEATQLADRTMRAQHRASRRRFRFWLEEKTRGGVAKFQAFMDQESTWLSSGRRF